MEILNVEDLTFTYAGADAPTLKDIGLSVNEGEFVLICGATGSGKSTLLKMFKEELRPNGEMSGNITFHGESDKPRIGFVMQNPAEQTVTDKVWHELAFGMENCGFPQSRMAVRSAEMAAFFGIEDWYMKDVNELSGGQMQLLNLASVMVTDPDILILDEPTAMLDPVSASEFLSVLSRINTELSLTIIIAEHRLEELIPRCDRMILMKDGCIAGNSPAREALNRIDTSDEIFEALPAAFRLYKKCGSDKERIYPVSIREGREYVRGRITEPYPAEIRTGKIKSAEIPPQGDAEFWLKKNSEDHTKNNPEVCAKTDPALEFKNVYLRYSREMPDVLSDFNLRVYKGEVFCIVGGNGSGKTTALKAAAGLIRPYSGHIRVFDKDVNKYKSDSLYNECLTLLPQDVQTLFMHNTVKEELAENKKNVKKKSGIPFEIAHLMNKHPYDLSGGEAQLVGLAKVLMTNPKLLLLDEPTKGLDAYKKRVFADIVKELKAGGMTVVIVTHDVEFAALCADRCAMCFRGSIVSVEDPGTFFEDNSFYTTSACRMSRGLLKGTYTVEMLAGCLGGNRPEKGKA